MVAKKGIRLEILSVLTLILSAALIFGDVALLRFFEKKLVEEEIKKNEDISYLIQEYISNMNIKEVGKYIERLSDSESSFVGYKININDNTIFSDLSIKDNSIYREFIKLKYSKYFFKDYNNYFCVKLNNLSNGFIYDINIFYNLDNIKKYIEDLFLISLLFIIIYVFIFVVAGDYLFSKSIFRPIDRLIYASKKMCEGEYLKLDLSGVNELTTLFYSFNEMAGSIKSKEQQANHFISELSVKNEELNRVRDELIRSERLASMGQMGAGLAHEIGNPLAALMVSTTPEGNTAKWSGR